MKETVHLNQFVDPFEATVIETKSGETRFDLSSLPRLDPLLVGKKVRDLPEIIKRLCGICPVAHHLAGVRALEDLLGYPPPTGTARAIREMLAHGSQIEQLARQFFTTDKELMVLLRAAGKKAMAAAGCPGHFPDVAVPGGVKTRVNESLLDELAVLIKQSIDRLLPVTVKLGSADPWEDIFTGVGVFLIDPETSKPDILGTSARVVMTPAGTPIADIAAEDWDRRCIETVPGSVAPRPVLQLESQQVNYRVGTLARHLKAVSPAHATSLSVLYSLRKVKELLSFPNLVDTPARVEALARKEYGTGLVDGPRGLLVHTYVADKEGIVTRCRILSPTAQNEPWLAQMLTHAVATGNPLEQQIRIADPCLPCTHAPEGAMTVTIVKEKPCV